MTLASVNPAYLSRLQRHSERGGLARCQLVLIKFDSATATARMACFEFRFDRTSVLNGEFTAGFAVLSNCAKLLLNLPGCKIKLATGLPKRC